jgi:exodeoxyribonuclease VII small subunit
MPKNFESSLKELNDLVEQMEKGKAPLEKLLEQFEHGVKLVNHCQTLLKTAEQKIEKYDKEKNALTQIKLKGAESD